MTVNLDAVREDLQRYRAGYRGLAADCIAHLPGLVAEAEQLRAAASTSTWVVILRSGDRDDDTYAYGPLACQEQAERFAEFLTREVDPAKAYQLHSPTDELLSWYGEFGSQLRVAS